MMKKKNKRKTATAAVLGAVGILTAGYLYWCSTLDDKVIWKEVTINGVALQGKTPEEAEQAIQKQFKKDYQNTEITVTLAGKNFETEVFPVLSLDASKEIKEAYRPGHEKWYARGLDKLLLKNQEPISLEILPEVSDPEKVDDAIKKTGIENVNTMKKTTWEQDEESLTIYKGCTGVKADTEKLKKAILDALYDHSYEVQLKCPEVEVRPEEVNLQSLYDKIYVKMSNAFLDKENDYAVVPSVQGVSFSVKEAEKQLKQAEEGSEVRIPFTITEPELSTEELTSMLYRDVLGSYTTYGGGSSGRITNMQLACGSCNDVIINPGATFSYNDTVGERTEARGFRSAPVIANGQLVPGIGGGICQVSSTLYAACLNAGLEIVERYPHSKPVAYIPGGMDATVSWGTLDYKFKNNTAFPIKIQASYANGAVSVQILGTREG